MPRYGAFAREDIDTEDYIAVYSDVRPNYTPITHPSDPITSNQDYYISIKSGKFWYEADAHVFDSCSPRFFDEANTESEENCRFTVVDGVIWLQATKPIRRYEQFLTRYGHEYWCNIKWPHTLLLIMFEKYGPTLQSEENRPALLKWEAVLSQRHQLDTIEQCQQHQSILKLPSRQAYERSPYIARKVPKSTNRMRKTAQRTHKRAVINNPSLAQRILPSLDLLPYTPPFIPHDWKQLFPPPLSADGTPLTIHAILNIMSFSCQGRLYSTGNYITSGIQVFLTQIIELMLYHKVGIMWVNDARFTKGTLDAYLPFILETLPNCRVFQFPTTYIHTGSRTQSFNRMGGAIAIVTHKWHGFITRSIPDPSGSGLINALDIKIGPYSMRTINVYLTPSPASLTPGPATILSRLTSYIQGPTSPTWSKSLPPLEYQMGYLQLLLDAATLTGALSIISGDFNASIAHSLTKSLSPLNLWIRVNGLRAPLQRTLHHLPDYHTWQSPTGTQRNTLIDHVLHTALPSNMHLYESGTVNNEIINNISDHHPTWLSFSLIDPFNIPLPFKKQPVYSHPDLDMNNSKQREEYNKHLTKRITTSLSKKFRSTNPDGTMTVSPQEGASGLAVILTHSVLSVHAKRDGLNKMVKASIGHRCHLARGRFKDCYSPQMRQLQSYLFFYTNMLRLAFPAGRKRWADPWEADSYQRLLQQWLHKWRKRYGQILNKITDFSPAARLPCPSHLSQKSFHSISREYLIHKRKQVQACLHVTNRERMREKVNPAIRRIDKMRCAHDLGKVIKALTGKEAGSLDLQSLPSKSHGQITDPVEVQQLLNTHFHDWHAIPKTLDPAAALLANNPQYWKHLLSYTPNGKIQLLNKKSNLPPALQDSLRRACAIKVTTEVQNDVSRTINAPITFEDFNQSLNDIKNGGAPGPSGATANMIKAWSPATRKLVHGHMNHIWTTRTIPRWFKDKDIKLVPKLAGDPSLDNMRPISLYEVLRKTWTTIIGKRIHLAWHNNDVLHNKQYGYRLDKGTPMALFSVLNEIEEANHSPKTTKHITFWDIKRAFDSIPRNLQKLAWTRLGVPIDVAEWFVHLDDGGLSFISSPYYHLNKNLHTPASMAGKNTHFSQSPDLAYKAERGIGQGESASSLMWTALYDILLEFIDPTNRHLHLAEKNISYSDEDAQKVNPSAYADDLATVTSGPNAEYMQQLQATWLSAFCAFAGLVIHPAKIRTTLLGSVPDKYKRLPTEGPLPFKEKTDLIIHDLNWKPISCPTFPHLQSVKYLGVDLELRNNPRSFSYHAVLQEIQNHLSHLLIQPGTPGSKIDYIQFKLIPIVLTTASCANWTLQQYRELDTPLSRAYRLILSLPSKSPESILYIPKSEMGIGLTRLSDKAQVMKWQALIRCLAVGGAPADSLNGFLNRLPPSSSSTTNHLRTLTLPTNDKNNVSWPHKKYTARSLLEWFHESGLTICCPIPDPTPREDQPRHNLSIADLAEDLHLWPSSIYDDEDNEPCNLRPVRLVATDGSFTIKPRGTFDVITPEHDLRCCGEGGGGFILLPPNYSENNTQADQIPKAVQIILKRQAPGMHAFIWELATQTVALQFTKYLNPAHVVYTSDCTAAIAITNQALRTHHNQLANARGGCLASGTHQLADTDHPRQFIHTFGHPERTQSRRENPTLRDKGMSIADATAAGETAKLGDRTFPVEKHVLQLDNLFSELIPPGQWHLRTKKTAHAEPFPVLGDILPFQHRTLRKQYCKKRDLSNNCKRWTSTSLAFAHKVHPPKNRSYWAAARRALVAFDWIGHGRNRAKPTNQSSPTTEDSSRCYLCGQSDSQAHCMLDCPHPPFHVIRIKARREQGEVALKLLEDNPSLNMQHFIKQFSHASWISSTTTSRIWLGLWNQDTIKLLFRQSISAPLSEPTRLLYAKLTRKLTAPLLSAYYEMQDILARQTHPTTLPTTHTNTPNTPTCDIPIPDFIKTVLENTHIQTSSHSRSYDNNPTILNHIADQTATHEFSFSNAAFGLQTTDIEP